MNPANYHEFLLSSARTLRTKMRASERQVQQNVRRRQLSTKVKVKVNVDLYSASSWTHL